MQPPAARTSRTSPRAHCTQGQSLLSPPRRLLREQPVVPTSLALLVLLPAPAWAIPSPDLVVNLFASAAQVLGLLTVVLGSFAYSRRRRQGAGPTGASPAWRWAFRASLILLLLSLGGNLLQYTGNADAKNQRLQVNILRPSLEQGKQVGDIDLKELPYSEQTKHPRGVHTEDLSRWLAEDRSLNLIDVREPEEVEMGRIPASWHLRYPDLRRDRSRLLVEGKKTVLLCFNGNRSSELSDEFARDGYSCLFVIGGYEKWIAEERPLELARARTPGEIRDIPDYPNKTRLLDTPEILELVQEEEVLFVDVRYPGEFEKHHLPEAVNVPMRKLPTDELFAHLKSLPRRPIVAPCYDRRSSFFALILGLRLHRLGYDFRGRYSVPHEFVLPRVEKAYVQRWRAEQEEKTLLGAAAAPLKIGLGKLRENLGSLLAAIACLAVVLRLAVLPLTLKAERDQVRQLWLADEVKALKEKLAGDPGRLARAILRLHRREGLTPLTNFAGTAVQITLLLVFFSVVNQAATGSEESFLWIPAAGNPDPFYLLSAAIGSLVFLHLSLTAARRSFGGSLLQLACGVLLFALTFSLRAAVNIYLCLNLALMLLQSRVTRLYLNRVRSRSLRAEGALQRPRTARRLEARGVIPLRAARFVPGVGNKAIRLSRMMAAGLPVPDGFALPDRIFSRAPEAAPPGEEGNGLGPPGHHGSAELDLPSSVKRQIERAWRRLGAARAAVRSSGLKEDGANKSYAGIFESVLNVRRENLFGAIRLVHCSLSSERAATYGNGGEERGGILIQEMVDAQYAGVLFTEHPAQAGASMVELVCGLGEELVSGSATPEAYRFGRLTGRLLDEKRPPIDLEALLELGKRVEDLFGRPQDIEWAYAGGRFHLLQSRDITTLARSSATPLGEVEKERHRLLELARRGGAQEGDGYDSHDSHKPVFGQNELSEFLPRPTPLSLSFMEKLWAAGGSTDLACRALGVPYQVEEDSPPYVNGVFGALYINRLEERRRLAHGPGMLAAFRLARSGDRLVRHFQEEFLPAFKREVRLREAMDFSRLSFEELHDLLGAWVEGFVGKTYVEAEVINIAADFYFKSAVKELEKRDLDPAHGLSKIPETVVHRAMSLLTAVRAGEARLDDFVALFGHRAPQDYELAQPRYRESPQLVSELLERAPPGEALARITDSESAGGHPSQNSMLALVVKRARDFQALKEEAKHHCLRELACIRSLLLEMDRRLELDGGIFFLTLDEASRLSEAEFLDEALDIIDRRANLAKAWEAIELPGELSAADLEGWEFERPSATTRLAVAGALRGTCVSGETEVVGRVRVVRALEEVETFKAGEILVARYTNPTWTPLFPHALGVITEVGGWLSHAAIVAREYRVPAIVGASGALGALRTGMLVRMCRDGTVQTVAAERRRHERVLVSTKVALLRQGEAIEAILRNLSASGVLIEVDAELMEGQGVRLRIAQDGEEVRAEVVRRDPSGGYALQFHAPLADPLLAAMGPQGN